MSVQQTDAYTGAFRVNIGNVNAPGAVKSMSVAVWSEKNGQDDLAWVTAKRSGDTWYVDIDPAAHNYDTGTYNSHCYAVNSVNRNNYIAAACRKSPAFAGLFCIYGVK
jgi:hypothetical protein